jgi:hypothetical protein
MLEEAVSQLLPTPRANIAKQGGPRKKHWGELRAEVLALLPTPVTGDGKGSRQSTAPNPRSPHPTLSDLAYLWSGGSTGQPLSGGKQWSGLRLSPWFVEWMDRSAARVERARLSALGDGVQVQVGYCVGKYLIYREAERVRAAA